MNLLRTYRPALERLAIVGALFCVTIGSAFAGSVTLNNTTNQLANAIQQAGPNGTVFLQGTIKEDHSVTIPYTLTLRGNRSTTLSIFPDNGLNGLVVLGDTVRLSNLRIVPSNAAMGNQGTAIYIAGQACRVLGCDIEGWRIGCFLGGSASQVWVGDNTFVASSRSQSAGFYSQFSVDTIFLAQNTFSGYQVGAYIAMGSGHRISGNIANNNDVGFWMDGAVDSLIAGNRVSGSSAAGILLDGGASGVSVYSNGVYGSGGDSILADADTSENRIHNNRVDKPVKDLGKNNVYSNTAG
jgi:parallel beta-helix repeat protein